MRVPKTESLSIRLFEISVCSELFLFLLFVGLISLFFSSARWVREGACLDRKGSCSFPTGMHCVPAATTTVHILRWQCRDRKMTVFRKSGQKKRDAYKRRVAEFSRDQQRRKKRCDWYRVPYPITIDCFCTC